MYKIDNNSGFSLNNAMKTYLKNSDFSCEMHLKHIGGIPDFPNVIQ
jgi:hypothetical protein